MYGSYLGNLTTHPMSVAQSPGEPHRTSEGLALTTCLAFQSNGETEGDGWVRKKEHGMGCERLTSQMVEWSELQKLGCKSQSIL